MRNNVIPLGNVTRLDLPPERVVTTSAKSGLGMDLLWRAIWATTHES